MFDSLLHFKGFESHDTGYYCGLWRDTQKLYLIKLSQKINLIKTFTYRTSTMLFSPPVFVVIYFAIRSCVSCM